MARQVASNSFGETAEPVLPLTAAERLVYGDELGTYFLDANFTPDFPRASALWRARWEQVYPEQVDGVVVDRPGRPLLPARGDRPGRGRWTSADGGQRRRRAAAPGLPALRGPRRPGRRLPGGGPRRSSTGSPRGVDSPRDPARPHSLAGPTRAGSTSTTSIRPSRPSSPAPRSRASSWSTRCAAAGRRLPQRQHRLQDVLLPAVRRRRGRDLLRRTACRGCPAAARFSSRRPPMQPTCPSTSPVAASTAPHRARSRCRSTSTARSAARSPSLRLDGRPSRAPRSSSTEVARSSRWRSCCDRVRAST